MKSKRVIVWFRQDLRLADNEALTHALEHADEVYPIYVFDERTFKGKTTFGFPKTGKFRTKFIIDSVQELRKNLKNIGSDLIVRVGKPEEVIFNLASELKSNWVFCNRERTSEEIEVQDALEKKLWSIGQEIIYSRGKMLYYTQDLPFPITHCPDSFNTFRKEVEKIVPVRSPLPKPTVSFDISQTVLPGSIPSLSDFGHEDYTVPKEGFEPKGGENAALQRLNYYLWETDFIKSHKKTKNYLMGVDNSSKLSPWLAQGCISPKTVYQELRKYESSKGSNPSTYSLFFELLWRDFFRLMAKKHQNRIFFSQGIHQNENQDIGKKDMQVLKKWINARTAVPFVNASMNELKQTGYISNKSRQIVASYLVNNLGVNWQLGADYFESILIDYDVASNYGNWAYIAGVGTEIRENKALNITSQVKKYDPKGTYTETWLPQSDTLNNSEPHPDKESIYP